MVFSAEGRILIKVWPANSPNLNLVDYRISGLLFSGHSVYPCV